MLDSNDDGNPDVWELYAEGRMTARETDRDDDGVRDAFYRYGGDSLEEERHDSNNDGQIDLIILYEDGLRVSAEEDRDTDGGMDSWTTYVVRDGREVVSQIERDELGQGTVTIVEVFDTSSGEAVISRKDEDVNGDGQVDVVSFYEAGKTGPTRDLRPRTGRALASNSRPAGGAGAESRCECSRSRLSEGLEPAASSASMTTRFC